MSYELSIIQKPMYLHAIVTGLNTKENVEGYLEEVLRECIARGSTSVLIEERLEGPRFGVADVFQVASEKSLEARGHFKGIAYVDVNASGDLMKFAETVAVNRGLPVKVFSTVSDAEKWLVEQ
jgi:hypothetical protein